MRWFRAGAARQLLSALVALTLVSVVLAACGSSGGGTGGTGGGAKGPKNALNACPTNTNSSTASAESGNITLTVSGWSSTPAEDTLVQQGFSNFEKLYPNITVNWTVVPGDYPT